MKARVLSSERFRPWLEGCLCQLWRLSLWEPDASEMQGTQSAAGHRGSSFAPSVCAWQHCSQKLAWTFHYTTLTLTSKCSSKSSCPMIQSKAVRISGRTNTCLNTYHDICGFNVSSRSLEILSSAALAATSFPLLHMQLPHQPCGSLAKDMKKALHARPFINANQSPRHDLRCQIWWAGEPRMGQPRRNSC